MRRNSSEMVDKLSLLYLMDVVIPTFQVGDISVALSPPSFRFFGYLFRVGGIAKG
jgi:hypothetical protein